MGYPQHYPQPVNYGQPMPQGYVPMPPQGSAPMAPQFMPPNIPGGYPTTPAQAPAAPRELGDPSGGGGGQGGPQPRHLVGRTVIIEPLSINDANEFGGQKRPTLTCNLIVVNGGPVQYGDNKQTGQPCTMASQTPARFERVFWNSGPIVESCRPVLPFGGNPGGIVAGVIEIGTKGTKGNQPYLITKFDKDRDGKDRPNAAQLRAEANAVWQAVESGTFVNPVPTPLAPQAGAAYGGQPVPQLQYAQPTPPGGVGPMYGYPQQQPYVPAPIQPVSAPAAAPVPAPTSGLPGGWAPEQWAMLSPEQQQSIAAQYTGAAQPQHPGI